MKLERVVIEDFKSIKKLNITLHDLTCLVGKNESGKSSILEAISFLNFPKNKMTISYTNKSSKRYDNDHFPNITGYFTLTELDNDNLLDLIPLEFNADNIAIPKPTFAFKWIKIIVSGDKLTDLIIDFVAGNNKGFNLESRFKGNDLVNLKNKILTEIIPNIELFSNDNLIFTPITLEQLNQKQPSNESFLRLFAIGGVKNTVVLKPVNIEKMEDKLFTIGEKITTLLQKNYSQDKSIVVQVKYTGNQFMVRFTDASNRSYSITEKSLGFQYFFAFLINKTYLNTIEERKNIFLLDEPGVSLHPEGARDLINIFEEIAIEDQIIYTTHNPFLAYRKKPDNLILAKKDPKNGTEIITKVYTNKYQVLRKELGLLLNDSFLVNDINLVVEGNADKYILHYIIHEDDVLEPLTWVHIFSADSATEIIPSVRYLNSLDLKGVVLLDADEAAKNEIKKPKFKTNITSKKGWSYLTLNNIIKDDKERTIEDMLFQEKFLEAYNKYYAEQAGTVEWKTNFIPIVPKIYDTPILNTLNPHFKKFADGGINKVAIFRKFTQLFPYDDNKVYYENLVDIIEEIQNQVLKLS